MLPLRAGDAMGDEGAVSEAQSRLILLLMLAATAVFVTTEMVR